MRSSLSPIFSTVHVISGTGNELDRRQETVASSASFMELGLLILMDLGRYSVLTDSDSLTTPSEFSALQLITVSVTSSFSVSRLSTDWPSSSCSASLSWPPHSPLDGGGGHTASNAAGVGVGVTKLNCVRAL